MTASLRIIHCFRAPVGGLFRHVRDLAAAQAAAGHQVGIICDSSTGGALEERYFRDMAGDLALGIERLPIRRNVGPGDLAAGWRTFGHIRRLKPDVLHGHGAKGGAIARLFGSLLRVSRYRVARLYSPHGGVLHYDPSTRKGRALFALERLQNRCTDRLLFVSEFEHRAFATKIGEPTCPWSVVYNGLRDEEFEPVSANPGAADFLFIGTMRDLKGPDIFIDALAEASRRLARDLTAIMVGDGEDLPLCKDQAQRLGLAEHIRFLPAMPAREAFALARMVVVPSRAEAMPYIVLEALAAGKPMIASAVGGIPEIFPSGSAALVDPDPESVAAAMAEAIRDETGFAAAMPALRDLRSRFSANVMAAAVEQAYRDCLSRQI